MVSFQRLTAPALCGAKPDVAATERRRAVAANGRSHVSEGRVVPRPAAIHSETLVSRCFGAALGCTFKICCLHRCAQRKPRSLTQPAGVLQSQKTARSDQAAPRLRHPPPRKTRRRGPVEVLVRGFALYTSRLRPVSIR